MKQHNISDCKKKIKKSIIPSANDNTLEINSLRSLLGDSIYSSQAQLSFLNEGTGFGKTHNAFSHFVKKVENNRKSLKNSNRKECLFFTTPNKMQIDVDSQLLAEAKRANIEVLCLLSIEDIKNPNFIRWDKREEKQTNLEFLEHLAYLEEMANKNSKDNKEGPLGILVKDYKQIFGMQYVLDSGMLESQDEIQNQKDAIGQAKDIFFHKLKKTTRTLLHDSIKDLSEVDSKLKSKKSYIYNLLAFTFPFEIAKSADCIILATTDKSMKDCYYLKPNSKFLEDSEKDIKEISEENEEKENLRFSEKGESIECLFGKKKEISKLISKEGFVYDDLSIDTFLTKKEENEDFFPNTVFNYVVDEEHEAYKKDLDSLTYILMPDSRTKNPERESIGGKKTTYINASHALATLGRLFNHIEGITQGENDSHIRKQQIRQKMLSSNLTEEEATFIIDNRPDDKRLDKEKREKSITLILEKMIRELSSYYKVDFSKQLLKQYLEIFERNVNHINVNSSSVDDVLGIVRNSFNFSGTQLTNREELKKIILEPNTFKSEILMYIAPETDDNDIMDARNITLEMLISIFLIFMKIISIAKPEDVRNIKRMAEAEVESNKEKSSSNQNQHLQDIINNAQNNKDILAINWKEAKGKDKLDDLFTYFFPKNIFRIIRSEKQSSDNLSHNKTKVDLSIYSIKYLPEVKMLRMLQGTKNNILFLSATSHLPYLEHHTYNRKFFKTLKEQHGFEYLINDRIREIQEITKQIRQKRISIRGQEPSIITYEKPTDIISPTKYQEAIYQELKRKHASFSDIHQYKLLEFERASLSIERFRKTGENIVFLSISNDVVNSLRKIADDEMCKTISPYQESKNVFFVNRAENNRVLKLVLITSESVAKEGDIIREALTLHNEKESVMIVSSFNSAGTGVNLYLQKDFGDKKSIDFNTLIIGGSPFYSDAYDDILGSNSRYNLVSSLKYFNGKPEDYSMDFINKNLIFKEETQNYINLSHKCQILSRIMQAFGRIERKDYEMKTSIFLPKDFFDDLVLTLFTLKESPDFNFEENMAILSMNNATFFNKVLKYVDENNLKDYNAIINIITPKEKILDRFFGQKGDGILHHLQKRAREVDTSSTDGQKEFEDICDFLDTIRDFSTVKSPATTIKNIQKAYEALFSYQGLVPKKYSSHEFAHAFYLHKSKDFKEILRLNQEIPSFYISNDSNKSLSCLIDPKNISYSDYLEHRVFPKIRKSSEFGDNSSYNIMSSIYNTTGNIKHLWIQEEYLIMPLFFDTIRGNIGETIFKLAYDEYFSKDNHKCLPLMTKNFLSQSGHNKFFEKFDFFLESKDYIVCIDVKFWNNNSKHIDRHQKLIERTKKKKEELERFFPNKTIRCYIVNVDINPDNDTLHKPSYHDIKFVNLFVRLPNKIKETIYVNGKERKKEVIKDLYCLNKEIFEEIDMYLTKGDL